MGYGSTPMRDTLSRSLAAFRKHPIAEKRVLVLVSDGFSTDGDPLITRYIPKVIAGLTGFDLGLRTSGEQANVAVEIVVDITDLNGNRVIPTGGSEKPIGEPSRTIEPPASGGGGN